MNLNMLWAISVGFLLLVAPQHADALIIDTFDTTQGPTTDSTDDGPAFVTSSGTPDSPDSTFATREIGANNDTVFASGGDITVDVGLSTAGLFTFAEIPDAGFNAVDGFGRIRYFDTTLDMEAQTHFAITARNASADTGNDIRVDVTLTDSNLDSATFAFTFAPNTSFETQIAPYSSFVGSVDLSQITLISLLMRDTSTNLAHHGEFEIDMIESLPEPSSALLAFLGSVGLAGYSARRRRHPVVPSE